MLKAIIVDDEEKGRIVLKHLIEENCDSVKLVDSCEDVDTAVLSIQQHSPDLVFLDIEMPLGDGFSLFSKFKKPDFHVIFTTAYDQYAIKAIRFSAIDYLLKPVEADSLIAAITRLEDILYEKKTPSPVLPDFELLLSNLKLRGTSAKIAIPTFEGLQMINSTEIIVCTAEERYTHISLLDGRRITVCRNLKEYEELLSEVNFFRVHHSYLINLNHVKNYVKGEGGYVVMTNGESIEVSRRKKTELIGRLNYIQL